MFRESDALLRACRYSFPPNALGYCGPIAANEALLSYIQNPKKECEEKIRGALQGFSALYPYLELIAQSNGLQPFDERVVESYWLGNQLLHNVRIIDLQRTVLSFQNHGLPRHIAEQKAYSVPSETFAHHSFHVLFVNFINQRLSALVKNLGNCLVQWAEVKEVKERVLRVKGIELLKENSELKLKEKVKRIENCFCLKPEPHNIVSVHWETAIEILSEEQLENLKQFTFRNLEAVKESLI